MSAAAAGAERERALPLKLTTHGLWVELGRPGGHCYRVLLELAVARRFAADLLLAAEMAEARAGPEMAQLAAITEVNRDG